MNLQHIAQRELGVRCVGQRLDKRDGCRMIDRLKMLVQRLATHRQALLNHQRRLVARQGVALDGVRGVGQLDAKPIV